MAKLEISKTEQGRATNGPSHPNGKGSEPVLPLLKTIEVGGTLRPVVPREYAGKWVAWSLDGTRIVAVGRSVSEVEKRAKAATREPVAIDRVPTRRRGE